MSFVQSLLKWMKKQSYSREHGIKSSEVKRTELSHCPYCSNELNKPIPLKRISTGQTAYCEECGNCISLHNNADLSTIFWI